MIVCSHHYICPDSFLWWSSHFSLLHLRQWLIGIVIISHRKLDETKPGRCKRVFDLSRGTLMRPHIKSQSCRSECRCAHLHRWFPDNAEPQLCHLAGTCELKERQVLDYTTHCDHWNRIIRYICLLLLAEIVNGVIWVKLCPESWRGWEAVMHWTELRCWLISDSFAPVKLLSHCGENLTPNNDFYSLHISWQIPRIHSKMRQE